MKLVTKSNLVSRYYLSIVCGFCVFLLCTRSDAKSGRGKHGMVHKPCFKELPDYVMLRHLAIAKHLPLCIVYRHKGVGSKVETELCQFWNTRNKNKTYSTWEVGAFAADVQQDPQISIPSRLPTLRCHLGLMQPFDFAGKITSSEISQWFEKLAARHADGLTEASLGNLRSIPSKNNLTLLGFPGEVAHYEMEAILLNIRDKWRQSSVAVMFVHPHSDDSRVLESMYRIVHWPTLVILDSAGDVVSRMDDDDSALTEESIEVFLYVRAMSVQQLTTQQFESKVLNVHRHFVPSLVCFYADFVPGVLQYLYAFHRTVLDLTEIGVNVKLALVDLTKEEDILYQYLSEDVMRSFGDYPFTVLFYPERKNNHIESVIQTVFPSNRPTPSRVVTFLDSLQLLMDSSNNRLLYHPWGTISENEVSALTEGPYGSLCTPHSHNMTDSTPRSYRRFRKRRKKRSKSKHGGSHNKYDINSIERRLPKLGVIPIVSETTWSEVIEKSHTASHPFVSGKQWRGEVTKVALVIFIMADCGSCKLNQPVFEELHSSVQFISGGSSYIVNCSSDPRICSENDVTGFPTLSAFRGVGWLESDDCISNETAKSVRYVRLDYHGVLQTNKIMEWFTNVAESAVTNLGNEDIYHFSMKEDVYLMGHLTPKYSSYLPRMPSSIGRNYFYPYECFRLVCERLYGQAGCYTQHSTSIPQIDDPDAEMIVSKVELYRRDGLEAVVTHLGSSLFDTLEEESNVGLHRLHKPHRYNLTTGQKCEDNHAFCTDVIAAFTRDHGRLPITHMTSESFHARSSFVFDEDLPVMVALVHQENITQNSRFLKSLERVARQLYQELVVVTVDVDQYPSWAGQFVPKGYISETMANDGEMLPSLYIYPRVVFIKWRDHRHAAFYPPVQSKVSLDRPFKFTSTGLTTYARKFLSNPKDNMIETDHF